MHHDPSLSYPEPDGGIAIFSLHLLFLYHTDPEVEDAVD
jgi:hypothetical protein